jgi:hypothetical protein
VTQVQFFQGTTSLGMVASAPYSMVWSNAMPGNYALTAVVTDNDGLTSTSETANIIVDVPPSVTLTNPAGNARFLAGSDIRLGADVSDAYETVTQVEFFQGTNSLGAITGPPYGLIWSNAPSGLYALSACATDNNGLISTSAVVNILVAGISITSPANYLVVTAPTNIAVSAQVTDDLAVSQVEFFENTTSLGIVTNAPYSLIWSDAPEGIHVLTAVATETGGQTLNSSVTTLTSGIVNVVVDDDPQNTDRDGDGMSDYLKFIEGRNPLVPGAAPDTDGVVDLQIYSAR